MSHDYGFPGIFIRDTLSRDIATIHAYVVKDDEIRLSKNADALFSGYRSDLPKKSGESYVPEHDGAYRLFLCVSDKNIEKAISGAVKSIPKQYSDIQIDLGDLPIDMKLLVSKLVYDNKRAWSMKTKSDFVAKNFSLVVSDSDKADTLRGEILGQTQSLVQTLVNMPSNILTPTNFAREIAKTIDELGLNDEIRFEEIGPEEIRVSKMGAFWGVAKGSDEEPRLITLEYQGGEKGEKPVVFVGKGLTFDSGGISLKPSSGMDAMKTDMAGAATALSAVIYAARRKLPINIVAVAACCENMPSGKSVKPGDVLTSMNGLTIEVVDTDAEGRLVLADALEYSKRFEGRYTIDMATLTGACISALGYVHTGLFSKDDGLSEKLISAGLTMQDPAWRLPLVDEHEEMLESKIADISNLCLGKGAGAQCGAVFLQKFAPENGWCHLDIAGPSASKGGEATGRPMALISEFLDNLAEAGNE